MSDGLGKQLAPAQAAGRPTHGADQRGDGTALSTGIPRVAPTARAPPARPGGAGTGGAQKIKGKNKVYAVAKGFCTGIFESWEACEGAIKGFKGAAFKSFASRADALAFLESHGVTTGGGQKEAPQQANGLTEEQRARIEAQRQEALARKREREAAEQAAAAAAAAELAAARRREDPHRRSAAEKARRNAKEKKRKKEKKRAARRADETDEQTIEQNEHGDENGGESAKAGAGVEETALREAALRAQIKSLKSLNSAIRKRTEREAKLAFSRGKRIQKREYEDAKRAKKKKRTVKQLRGIAGDARRHKSKAEGQKRRGQVDKQTKR